jgi:hypothetical protein
MQAVDLYKELFCVALSYDIEEIFYSFQFQNHKCLKLLLLLVLKDSTLKLIFIQLTYVSRPLTLSFHVSQVALLFFSYSCQFSKSRPLESSKPYGIVTPITPQFILSGK